MTNRGSRSNAAQDWILILISGGTQWNEKHQKSHLILFRVATVLCLLSTIAYIYFVIFFRSVETTKIHIYHDFA